MCKDHRWFSKFVFLWNWVSSRETRTALPKHIWLVFESVLGYCIFGMLALLAVLTGLRGQSRNVPCGGALGLHPHPLLKLDKGLAPQAPSCWNSMLCLGHALSKLVWPVTNELVDYELGAVFCFAWICHFIIACCSFSVALLGTKFRAMFKSTENNNSAQDQFSRTGFARRAKS